MYILGINASHLATACLIKDGKVEICISEERLTCKKGQAGLPKEAIKQCLQYANISIQEVEKVVIGYTNPLELFSFAFKENKERSWLVGTKQIIQSIFGYICFVLPGVYDLYDICFAAFAHVTFPTLQNIYAYQLGKRLGIAAEKIVFCDHHIAHAYATYYIHGGVDTKQLVITNDGSGDDSCGKVFVVKDNVWKEIAQTPNKYSLGYLYYFVTQYLGFRPNQDEYKVMGLAPYAAKKAVMSIYTVLQPIFLNNGLGFYSKIPTISFPIFLQKTLKNIRFDAIAGGIQQLTEALVVQQVKASIKKTGIHAVMLSGGVAMNIKANMAVASLKEVKELFVCPSSGDESTAIGAAFWGYQKLCKERKVVFIPQPVKDLYLGSAFGEQDIKHALQKEKTLNSSRFKVTRLEHPAPTVAKLLSKGEIVARFVGRMEFGARALGNRSILADPRDRKVVDVLNQQIKSRDFWMPFAPVILAEKADKYLINPKKLYSPFMMVGFSTPQSVWDQIPAVLHPADKTCRPQMLKKEDNPAYWEIIKEFEKLTGLPVLLNTSFNLHGEPIVCTPENALKTFKNSGLKYLLLEDWLIEKK